MPPSVFDVLTGINFAHAPGLITLFIVIQGVWPCVVLSHTIDDYLTIPQKAEEDSRWCVHRRQLYSNKDFVLAQDKATPQGQNLAQWPEMISNRKANSIFSAQAWIGFIAAAKHYSAFKRTSG